MTTVDTADEFRIGRVVSRLFEALFANAVTFLALTALLTIPSLLLTIYAAMNGGQNMGLTAAGRIAPGAGGHFFAVTLVSVIVYLIFTFLLQAALTQGTISWLNGERSSFGEALSVAMTNFLPLVAIALLSGLGIGLASMLLVVPGIIVAMMWSVVVPVKVVERTRISEAFGRSRALTKGHRGKIFLLFLAYFVVAIAAGFAMRPLLGVAMVPKPGDINIAYILVDWLLRVVLTSITAVGATSVYYELRLVKEGVGAEQMAAAFD